MPRRNRVLNSKKIKGFRDKGIREITNELLLDLLKLMIKC